MMHPQTKAHWVRLSRYWAFLLALSMIPVVLVFGSIPDPGLVKKALSFTGVFIGLIVLWRLYLPPIRRRARDRKLVAAALAGQPPTYGARSAILGVIRADAPVRSPITDQPCAAFSYHVFHHQAARNTRDVGRNRQVKGVAFDTYHCSGYHLAESTIDTEASSFKLLGFPVFHGATRTYAKPYGDQATRATALRESTQFEPTKVRQAMKELRQEQSGRISRDWCIKPLPDEPDDLVHVEDVLPLDVEVCAIGTYDAGRGGLVGGESSGDEIRIIVGDGESALSELGFRSWLRFWK